MHEETTTKEKILKKIRKALIQKSVGAVTVDFDSNIYQKPEEPLEVLFAQQLTKLNGKFIYCESEKDFSDKNLAVRKEILFQKCADKKLVRRKRKEYRVD